MDSGIYIRIGLAWDRFQSCHVCPLGDAALNRGEKAPTSCTVLEFVADCAYGLKDIIAMRSLGSTEERHTSPRLLKSRSGIPKLKSNGPRSELHYNVEPVIQKAATGTTATLINRSIGALFSALCCSSIEKFLESRNTSQCGDLNMAVFDMPESLTNTSILHSRSH